MQYVIIDTGKSCIKKHYKNKLHLLFIKIYCYFKHYEII